MADSILTAAELILGVRLPQSYRALAQRYPSGRPLPNEFTVKHRKGTWGSCVGVLLSIDPRHSGNVFQHISHLAGDDQLPAHLVPIIDDGGGDLVCLDYRGDGSQPSVVYWAHELGGEDGLVQIASSFDEFLRILEEEGEDEPGGA